MTSVTSSELADGGVERSKPRRKRLPSLSGVHLLIVATGVLALVANLALLRRGEAPLTRMAVTAVDLQPGRSLQPDHIELVPMDVPEPVESGLISEAELADYQGWVVTAPMGSGFLLGKANLRAPSTTSEYRAMSLPVEVEHAAGGDLLPGDLVDVIRVDDEEASYVATGLRVLDIPGQTDGAFGLSGSFYLVLQVDDRTALKLALALANAEVEVLRSTGSASVTVRSVVEPSLSADDRRTRPASEGFTLPGSPGAGDYPPLERGLLP